MRPTGSSYWLRWPEFGLSLEKEKTAPGVTPRFKVGRWRGDRVKAQWPEFLEWGKDYPFTGVYPTGTLTKQETHDDEPF
jgi:replicative DNA helicase